MQVKPDAMVWLDVICFVLPFTCYHDKKLMHIPNTNNSVNVD